VLVDDFPAEVNLAVGPVTPEFPAPVDHGPHVVGRGSRQPANDDRYGRVGILDAHPRPEGVFVAVVKRRQAGCILAARLVGRAAFPGFVAFVFAFDVPNQAHPDFDRVGARPGFDAADLNQIRVQCFVAAITGHVLKPHPRLLDVGAGNRQVATVEGGTVFVVALTGRVGIFHPFRNCFETGQYLDAFGLAAFVHGVVVPATVERRVERVLAGLGFQFIPINVMPHRRKSFYGGNPGLVDLPGSRCILEVPLKYVDTQ